MPDPSRPTPEQEPPQPLTDPVMPPMRDPPDAPYTDPVNRRRPIRPASRCAIPIRRRITIHPIHAAVRFRIHSCSTIAHVGGATWENVAEGLEQKPQSLGEARRAVTDTAQVSHIRIKRAYDEPGSDDGLRILIDRLWPRGMPKAKLKLDAWVNNFAEQGCEVVPA